MRHAFVLVVAFVAGCGVGHDPAPASFEDDIAALPPDVTRPTRRPAHLAPPPPDTAVTVEQFDTTTQEERVAASQVTVAADNAALGRTVATLGNPAETGFWLETPLVSQVTQGHVVSAATGERVAVELRPIEGPDGAGSRISLAALRLLNVGLAGLHELDVFSG